MARHRYDPSVPKEERIRQNKRRWYAKRKSDLRPVKAAYDADRYRLKQEIKAGSKRPSRCEVCGDDWRISLDHDHITNEFRGWLCGRCNSALGYVKDNPETLRSLADYLERSLGK